MLPRIKILGAATVALAAFAAWAGSAGTAEDHRRATWRALYRPPAAIPFPQTNPYSPAKAELGRRLFFDPILSGDNTRACVTCHQPSLAWADGRPRAASRVGGDMDIHTPSLLNVAWQDGPLGWDGKFRSLEAVARGPITGPGNMNLPMKDAIARLAADKSYRSAFEAAFGDPTVSADRLDAALATFERTILSPKTPFDRWIAGDEAAISDTAKRGFDLFNSRAGCAECHSGWAFTDNSFQDIGTATGNDRGRGTAMPRSVALQYAFKTPTLREVAGRGSYMHDGSVPTLEAVIALYDRGGIARPSRSPLIKPLNLTAEDKAALVAFLGTLSADGDPGETATVFKANAPTP